MDISIDNKWYVFLMLLFLLFIVYTLASTIPLDTDTLCVTPYHCHSLWLSYYCLSLFYYMEVIDQPCQMFLLSLSIFGIKIDQNIK